MLPTDPNDRKARPVARGVLDYFPDAIAAVAHVSHVGNEQHNPGQPMRWARDKSSDHADCIARHLIERGTTDTDGLRHSAKLAWRALANLQIEIEGAAPRFGGVPCPPTRLDLLQELSDEAARVPAKTNVDGEYEPCPIDTEHWPTKTFAVRNVGRPAYDRQEYLADLIERGTSCPIGRKRRRDGTPRAKVYIAGPMRGYEKFNFPAFDEARDLFVAKGYAVISPADIDRAAGLNENDTTIDVGAAAQAREFFERDAFALHSLRAERGDGIVMLNGWESSTGAAAEFMMARWLGLRVFSPRGKPLSPARFEGVDLLSAVTKYLCEKAGEK